MNASLLDFAFAAQAAADALVDQALQRHGLLQLVRQRRLELAQLRDREDRGGYSDRDQLDDAEMRLAMAQASLEDFDRLVADRAAS